MSQNTLPPVVQQLGRLLKRHIVSLLLVALGCVVVLSLLTYAKQNSEFGVEALHRTQDFKQRIDRLDKLLALILDAETGARGYTLLDLNPVYLEPYNEFEKNIDPLMNRIEKDYLPGDRNRDEFEKLKKNLEIKRNILGDTIRAGKVLTFPSKGRMGPGKSSMDNIRVAIQRLRQNLEEENAIMVNESERRFKSIQLTVTILSVCAIGLIVALFGFQQRQALLRHRLNELLEREKFALESKVKERTEELSNLAGYLTNVLETERGRLAREMHDELGALLTAAKMDSNWLLRKLGPENGPEIEGRIKRQIQTIGSCIALKRRIIDDLRPPLLQGLGLSEALRAFIEPLQSEFNVTFQLPQADPPFSADQSLALFRIVQESVTNIRKYANASQVDIGLQMEGEEVKLWIVDNGDGFDVSSPRISHHGLAGMRHRVQMFNGHFDINSTIGRGTRIEVRMPLQAESINDQPIA